jgi:hypothetical protein
MPIRYRDQDDIDDLGSAGFVRIESDPRQPGYRGALFQVNARGEPLEFTYATVTAPGSFLWQPGMLQQSALKKLLIALFRACPATPSVLLCLAEQVPAEVFARRLDVAIPVCRVSAPDSTSTAGRDSGEDGQAAIHLAWTPAPPDEHSVARRLTDELKRRNLLLEPFERAAVGLREVFVALERGVG